MCEQLAQHPAVQAIILGGSRYTGGWDKQSDLDIIVILEDYGDVEKTRKAAHLALIELKERYHPGYMDRYNPDREVQYGHIVVTMECFLAHRRTLNHPMAQASRQGRIIPKEPGSEGKYQHDGDTSNEWELVTLKKLEMAADRNRRIPMRRERFNMLGLDELSPFTISGRTAYWLLWSAGSALMSMLGIAYRNRSLLAMADTLRKRGPEWRYEFASDLDCLDQYNSCACEVVVVNPIANLDAIWDSLERDRDVLWQRIKELSGYDLNERSPADETL